MGICEICHKQHRGIYGSGRFCSSACSSKSRKKNRAKTIAKKRKLGIYKKLLHPTMSNLEKNVSKLLTRYGIKHETQFQLGKYYFDIKIDNVLLEVQGDYWHANPLKYNADTIIMYPGHKKKSANTVWKKDLKKKLQATKRGYKVIYIWQQEVHACDQPKLYQTLLNRINNQNQQGVY